MQSFWLLFSCLFSSYYCLLPLRFLAKWKSFVNQVNLPSIVDDNHRDPISLVFLLRFALCTRKTLNLNTGICCVLFVLLGFSSWIMLPIRANANTVINRKLPIGCRQLLAYTTWNNTPKQNCFTGQCFPTCMRAR